LLHREVPGRSIQQIIEILEMEGKAGAGALKRTTLQDVLQERGYSARQMKLYQQQGVAARRFARLERNDLWHSDIKFGPFLMIWYKKSYSESRQGRIRKKQQKGAIQMEQRRYTAEYRANAVKLAKEIGGSAASRELKVPADTLYTWMSRAKNGDLPLATTPPEAKNVLNLAERVKELERENKALRSENAQILRENQILEEAASFFAARRKKSGSV